jgi:hypothetical protein
VMFQKPPLHVESARAVPAEWMGNTFVCALLGGEVGRRGVAGT